MAGKPKTKSVDDLSLLYSHRQEKKSAAEQRTEATRPSPRCKDGNTKRRALLIGVDGMRADAFIKAHTPAMDRIAAKGAFTFDARTQLRGRTLSGPGWASILTGVDVDKHGVRSNKPLSLNPTYPTFLKRLRSTLNLSVGAVLEWAPLKTMFETDALDECVIGASHEVVTHASRMLKGRHQGIFVHLDQVDHAGHASGFSPENPSYIAAIEGVDEAVGQWLAIVEEREKHHHEEWLVVLTSDHGGSSTSHGKQDLENQQVPLLMCGAAVIPGPLKGKVSHMDAVPTIMTFLGLEPNISWGLDGTARGIQRELSQALSRAA